MSSVVLLPANVRFQTLVDNHVSCLLMIASYTRWIGFRLEMLAIVFTSITAFLVVVTKDQVQISFAGLAIVYASEVHGSEGLPSTKLFNELASL